METTNGTKMGTTKRPRCAPCKSGKSPETTALTVEENPRCRYCGGGFEGRYLTLAQCTGANVWVSR